MLYLSYKLMASPPAASMAAFAEALNLCAVTFRVAFNYPLPNIFTKSFLWTSPFSNRISRLISLLTEPLSTNSWILSRLIPRYSFLLMLVNPNLGTLLCKGICPPSNPIFLEYPDLDLAPLCPRVEVPPLPEPSPLPTRFPSLWTAPCAGLRLCNSICRYYLGLLCGNQMLYLTYHSKDIGRGIVFDNMPDLAQAKCLQGPFLVLWPFDRAPNLF